LIVAGNAICPSARHVSGECQISYQPFFRFGEPSNYFVGNLDIWGNARLVSAEFTMMAQRGKSATNCSLRRGLVEVAVFVYLFRHTGTRNLALTSDVTGRNISAVTSTTNWLFVEAIDTLKLSVRRDTAGFQAVLAQLRLDGFYLFEAGITDLDAVLARGLRPRPQ
jgi:hypothetical protein